MSIYSEIQKLQKSKTEIRKAIQQNGSSMSTDSTLENYSVAIDNFDGTYTQDLTGVPELNTNSYTQMVLPVTVMRLRDNALQGNTSLKELVLNSITVVTLGKNVFRNTRFETDGIIYVPDDLVSTYRNDENWGIYNIDSINNFTPNREELYPLQTLDRHFTISQIGNLTIGEIDRKE